MSTATYPVHVDAQLDQRLSRGLWLVKWLLAIPHYVVLAFLWVAFVLLSGVALVAILVTGRYPRAIFDFNVGVLRWTWRVAYYAYGALGTDRYPPFSLHERADYPAHLEIDYPEHLSRGLVLVKWWLLAIPHYLVLALLLGGVSYTVNQADTPSVWRSGLIGVLVLVAAVVLLFTGRYPQPIFDLVLGLNRWVIRVGAYVALMTDQYPPFRLDQGGHEPGVALTSPGTPGPTAPPPAPLATPHGTAPRSGWTASRIVALVAGCLLVATSAGFGLAGGALAIADHSARDDAGYLMSGTETFSTPTYALTSTNLEMHVHAPAAFMPDNLVGTTRLTADVTGETPIFLGLARTSDVRAYLAGVRHATVVDVTSAPVLRTSGSSAPGSLPASQDFWVTSTTGTGHQSLTWEPRNGDWTVVMMNADGSAGVGAELAAGATFPALDWLVPTLLVVAGLALVAGVLLVAVPARAAGRATQP